MLSPPSPRFAVVQVGTTQFPGSLTFLIRNEPNHSMHSRPRHFNIDQDLA
uniref:Uncharacterized protein n=1 Tax=Picea glauca TaxID=3330 RepID=A0A101M2R6_PICGL|nr:hypothetical protein ABT39_MTgene3204 [Picea glauca]